MKFTALALVGSLSAYDFTFACDDHAIVYVDGAAIGENKNWKEASTVSTDNYQEGKSVIAFEGHETYSHGSNKGFIGVLAGKPTDPADWLCKYYKNSNPPSNWKDTSFDDTEWETPISIGINHNPGVDDKAQWMWLDGQKNENSAHVYCRYGGTHGVDPNSELQQKLDKLLSENEGKKVLLATSLNRSELQRKLLNKSNKNSQTLNLTLKSFQVILRTSKETSKDFTTSRSTSRRSEVISKSWSSQLRIRKKSTRD